MATLDNGKVLVEYRLIEQKAWSYLESKTTLAQLLSWNFGAKILATLHSDTMHKMSNEELGKTFITHFVVSASEQEEYGVSATVKLVGSRTGQLRDIKAQVGSIKHESPLAVVNAWLKLFESPKQANDSSMEVWRNAWRLAYSQAVKFVTPNEAKDYCKQFGVSPAIFAHAQKHWQSQSPSMLNKSYQNGKPVAKPVAKPNHHDSHVPNPVETVATVNGK